MKVFEIHYGDLCSDAMTAFMEFHNTECASDLPLGPIVHLEKEEGEDDNEQRNNPGTL